MATIPRVVITGAGRGSGKVCALLGQHLLPASRVGELARSGDQFLIELVRL